MAVQQRACRGVAGALLDREGLRARALVTTDASVPRRTRYSDKVALPLFLTEPLETCGGCKVRGVYNFGAEKISKVQSSVNERPSKVARAVHTRSRRTRCCPCMLDARCRAAVGEGKFNGKYRKATRLRLQRIRQLGQRPAPEQAVAAHFDDAGGVATDAEREVIGALEGAQRPIQLL